MNPTFGCVRNTIKLASGRYFDLLDPQPAQLELGDIAAALSKLCRFGGHCRRFYSVAQHSVLCAVQARHDGLTRDEVKAVFLHDASEAFVGDVVKPLKIALPQYQEIEARVAAAIGQRFGIDFAAHAAAIEKIDRELLIAERRALFDGYEVLWTGELDIRGLDIDFEYWPPDAAEALFLIHATRLDLE